LRNGAVPLADLSSEDISPKAGIPLRWYNALVPIAMVIFTTLAGLWYTGIRAAGSSPGMSADQDMIQYVSFVIGQSDSFSVLMWAAFIGSFTAIILAVSQRILSMNEALMAWGRGVKSPVMAALILTLAWAIGNICSDLQTAEYVIALTEDLLSPHLLPLLSFLISGIIAFST
jgi:Na+/H+ antiporter NhaC